ALSALAAATLALKASATSRAVKLPLATPSRIALTPSSVISVIPPLPPAGGAGGGRVRRRHTGPPLTPPASGRGTRAEPAASLDHLRHAVKAVLGHGRIGEHLVAHAAARQRVGIDHVLAQAQLLRDHRGHRLDAGAIDLAELLDPAENGIELGHHPVEFVLAHPDAREAGDLRHGFASD